VTARQEIVLQLFSCRDWGDATAAEEFLSCLPEVGPLVLEAFGNTEPARRKYGSEGPKGFVEAWLATLGAPPAVSGDMVLRFKKKGSWGSVSWGRGPKRTFNTLSIGVSARSDSDTWAALLAFGSRCFPLLHAEFGALWLREEFSAQHTIVSPAVVGVDLSKAVPGVYFANYYGPTLVNFWGRSRFTNLPSKRMETIGDGVIVLTANDPAEWDSEQSKSTKQNIREHLGDATFFDINEPHRRTMAPSYDFSAIRTPPVPLIELVTNVNAEYFASSKDALRFISSTPQLAEEFRIRLPGYRLDYSRSSLKEADAAIREVKDHTEDPKTLVQQVAAYYGETLRRLGNGVWELDEVHRAPAVQLGTDTREYPIVRASKAFEESASLSEWFTNVVEGRLR